MLRISFIAFLVSLNLTGCASLESISKKKIVHFDKPLKESRIFNLSWIKNLDPIYNTGNLPIGTSTPLISDDIVYMGDLSGTMNAYDLSNGETIWKHNEKSPIQAEATRVGDQVLYGTQSGRLFSRHYLTGKLLYSTDLGAPVESAPVFHQGRAVIHLRNHTLISLDASSGKVLWRYRRAVPFTTTLQRVSKVLPYDNSLVVGFADGYIASLSIEEGVVNWEQKISTGVKFVDVDVRPIYFKGLIVAGSAAGPMRFINPKNGVILRTSKIFQAHRPLIAEDNLIVGSVFGEVSRIDQYGKVILTKKISKDGISDVKRWRKGLLVTTMGEHVYYLNEKTFDIEAQFNLGSAQSAVFGSAVVKDGYLALYSSRNRLYIFK